MRHVTGSDVNGGKKKNISHWLDLRNILSCSYTSFVVTAHATTKLTASTWPQVGARRHQRGARCRMLEVKPATVKYCRAPAFTTATTE